MRAKDAYDDVAWIANRRFVPEKYLRNDARRLLGG
jgi:hypothetical protein